MCGYVACVPECRGSVRNYTNIINLLINFEYRKNKMTQNLLKQ
jgi:hypothetical protein